MNPKRVDIDAHGSPLSRTQHEILLRIFKRYDPKKIISLPNILKLLVRFDFQENFSISTLFENGSWVSVGVAKFNPNDDCNNRSAGMKIAFGRAIKSYLFGSDRSLLHTAKKEKKEEKDELAITQLEAIAADEGF